MIRSDDRGRRELRTSNLERNGTDKTDEGIEDEANEATNEYILEHL
jgi:hypothetical protein